MQSIAQVLIDSSSDNGEMETPWNEYSLMHMTAGVCVYMYQERAIMTPSPATEIFPLRLWLWPLNTVPLFLTFHFFFFSF